MIPTATGFRSIQYIGAAPLNMTWDSIITFGDSVARTDSSGSGQPLFIKLK
jgi:hypothetical protein